ncbi:class I SAM-dependent methyltransferase [Pyrodictium abyssi]
MREKYNVTSSGYDELYRDEQFEKYMLAMRSVKLHGKVLDNGCGTGLFLEYLASTHGVDGITYYICLDLSPGMLDVARKRTASLGLAHMVEHVEADAENLPLRSESVNYTVSFTVVDLVEDKSRALKEMDRVTKLYAVVTSLKKAHKIVRELPNYGLYIGETSKDYAFIRIKQKHSRAPTVDPSS